MDTLGFLCGDSQRNNFRITADNDEKICIFLLKKSSSVDALKAYRKQFPDRSVIVIFKNNVKGTNIVNLNPPVTPQKLLNALNQAELMLGSGESNLTASASLHVARSKKPEVITQSTEQKFISSRPDIDLENPEEVDKIRYHDERYLQGRLQSAYKKGKKGNTSEPFAKLLKGIADSCRSQYLNANNF